MVAKFEQELSGDLDTPIGTTAVELDSRTATVRTREAAIGNLIADAMRWSAHDAEVAVTNGGGIRAGKSLPAGLDHHPARRSRRAAVRQPYRDDRGHAAAISGARSRTGCRNCPIPAAAFRRCPVSPSRPMSRRPPGEPRSCRSRSATRRSTTSADLSRRHQRLHGARRRRLRRRFRDANPLLPPADSPLMAAEVIDYIKSLGTLRTGCKAASWCGERAGGFNRPACACRR